jgi:hypothetical protein
MIPLSQIRTLYEQCGYRAAEIHSDMDPDERDAVLERLRRGASWTASSRCSARVSLAPLPRLEIRLGEPTSHVLVIRQGRARTEYPGTSGVKSHGAVMSAHQAVADACCMHTRSYATALATAACLVLQQQPVISESAGVVGFPGGGPAADGALVSAEELLEHVWDASADPFSNIVSVTIARLRRKLGDPPLIETVVGNGYRM